MLLQDLRYACRTLRSRPLSAAVAVLSLALGIGVNTAVFTIADQVLLRSLPVRAPEQLVNVTGGETNAYPIYREFRDRNQVFDGFLAASPSLKAALRAGSAETEVVNLRLVSGNFFGTLGVGTAVGRPIQERDDKAPGASPVAVVSYGLWTRLFARNTAALGSQVSINGYPLRIVGVVERSFHGLEAGQETDVYVPIHMTGQVLPSFAKGWSDAGWHWLSTMGRLKPGVTVRQAEAALNVLAPHVAAAVKLPTMDRNLPSPVEVAPGAQGMPFLRRELERPVLVLMCLSGLVLLIACANVANLWLAGAAARRREIAIREAVGASRWRLMRQLLTESAVVAALGGAAGLLLASWVSDILAVLIAGTRESFHVASSLDARVLAFTGAVSAVTGLLFGLVPAWRGSRSSVMGAMRPTGISAGGRTLGARLLAAAQVALSVVLLVGAGLFARTLGNLRGIDTNLARENVLLVDVQPADLGYSGQRLRVFYDSLAERARAHPGVMAASLSMLTPLSGGFRASLMTPDSHPVGRPAPYVTPTSPGYFATMGIPMLAGRDFLPEDEPAVAAGDTFANSGVSVRLDRPAPPKVRRVAILSESLARRFFDGANAVGRRVSYGNQFRPDSAFEIVGVVKDVRYGKAKDPSTQIMYMPNWVEGTGGRTLAVRTTGDPNGLIAALRADLRALDPAVPIHRAVTLETQLDGWLSTQRLLAYLSSGFGLLAALLAAVGLYGVLANGVARRTKEIGIRMAMGADRRSVLAMVLRESGAVALGGTAAGLAGAAMLTRLIAKLLYGVKPLEPLVFAGAAVLLLTVCIAAAWAPARRAASVDPIKALRYE